MAVAADNPAALSLVDCQLSLPMFEGPLDVLLRLIERSQLDVTDVSLVSITDQFLAYVSSLSDIPADLLAEFTALATRLLLLKSRSLLPVPPRQEEEPEPDDLASQLRAYQAAKLAADVLRERERAGLSAFGRAPQPIEGLPMTEHLVPVPLSGLARALRRCLDRGRPAPTTYTPAPIITLAGMTRRLLDGLRRRTTLRRLLGPAPSRAEMTVGFIALLSLMRRRVVVATQESLFGEIEVERIADPSSEPADD